MADGSSRRSRWHFREVLANQALRRVLAAFAVLNVSEWAFVTALSIHAFRVGGTLAVGLIGLRLLAGAISSALLAPLLDWRPRALTVIAASRCLLLGSAALLVLSGAGFGLVLTFVVLDSVAAAGYRPAQSRLLPVLARSPTELSQAAAGISMVKTLGQALGALIGGIAVSVVSPGVALVGAAGLMAGAVTAGGGVPPPASLSQEHRLSDLQIGLSAFGAALSDRVASPLVVASVLRTLVRGLWSALLVVVTLRLLHLGSSGFGLLQAAASLGAAIALPITASLIGRPRLGLPCAVSFITAGVTVSLVGLAPVAAIALLLAAAWGVAMAVADATSLSILHRLLDARALSRTVAVMESLKLSAEGIGALLAPALVAVFGLRGALVATGLPLPIMIALSWTSLSRTDARAEGRSRLVALLHGLNLFSGLDMASLEDLAARLHPVVAAAGVEMITQGDEGDRFYAIEAGQAEVLIDGYTIGQLGAGRGFGEKALLRESPRTATVRATTAMRLQAIDRADFLSAMTGSLPTEAMGVASGPLPLWLDPLARPRTAVLGDLTLFSGVDHATLEKLAATSTVQNWSAGSVIVREGDPGLSYYVILAGHAHATIAGRAVGTLMAGDGFGEIALLHATPRTATVTAGEALTTLTVPGPDLLEAIGG